VTRDQAGIFEVAGLAEFPHDLVSLLLGDTLTVRIVVFHVRILLHGLGVLEIFGSGRQYEFVDEFAVVAQHELDLLTLLDLDPVQQEQHFAVGFDHRDLNDPGRLCRVARLAGRKRGVVMLIRGPLAGQGRDRQKQRRNERDARFDLAFS
jgi:hypothetical protein